ncbi:MAG: hypothetical protein Q9170_004395 [Blastenia crenularia]
MSASQSRTPASSENPTSIANLELDMPNLLPLASSANEIMPIADVVAQMLLETELGQTGDVVSRFQLCIESKENGTNEPAWYNPKAMYAAALPSRLARGEFTKQLINEHKAWICQDWKGGNFRVLDYGCGSGIASEALSSHIAQIVGIDEDGDAVKIYNEISKRLQHPTCIMQAHLGDFLPHFLTGKVPGIGGDMALETIGKFDLAVISVNTVHYIKLGMDCFEILNLSPAKRHQQLVANLKAIVDLLTDDGTLLIIDIQKTLDPPVSTQEVMVDGYKISGYHSNDIVHALRYMDMNDIEVKDDNHFQWEGIAEQKKLWFPAEADEVIFMLKARKQTLNSVTSKEGASCSRQCARCGKPASKSCAACQNAPGEILGSHGSIWYCGADCQRDDWVQHKSTCRILASRKVLYRAAETAQELFYVYREIAFDKLIVKVERKKGEMILHEGHYEECFVPFPAALFPDEKDKKAVLAYLACGDAYGYLDVVLQTMLEGTSSKTLEAPVKIKPATPLKIREFWVTGDENPVDYQHEVLIVTLKDGSRYVVDLAGAQYGYHEPIIPFNLYEESGIRKVSMHKAQAVGYQRQYMQNLCKEKGTWQGAIRCYNEILYQCLNDQVKAWQSLVMPLPAMLRLGDKDFQKTKQTFVHCVDVAMREYKRLSDEQGKFKVQMIPYLLEKQAEETHPEEQSYDEFVAEFMGTAARHGTEICDMRGMGW